MVEWDMGVGGAGDAPRRGQTEIKQRIDDAWKSLLEVMKENPEKAIREFIEYSKSANIRRFSLLNQFFLFAQSGGKARFVLTKRAWERLGRTVKAGEKPYRVFVLLPIPAGYGRRRGPGRHRSTRTEHGRCSGYVYIEHEEYDISQTEGEYIVEPVPVEGAPNAPALLRSLEDYSSEHCLELTTKPITDGAGSPEEYRRLITALGSTDGRRIYLRKDLGDTQRARVLAHELAHAHMHVGFVFAEPEDGKPPANSAQWEVEAEAVACLVCAAWGIDTIEESRYYLMLFKEKDIRMEDVSERILLTVRTILSRVNPSVPLCANMLETSSPK